MRNFLERYKAITNKDVSKYEELLTAQPVEYETYEEEEFEDEIEDDSGPYEEKAKNAKAPPKNKKKRVIVKKDYSTRAKRIKSGSISPKHTISYSTPASNSYNSKPKFVNYDQKFLPLVNIDTIHLMPSLLPTTCLPTTLFVQPSINTNAIV